MAIAPRLAVRAKRLWTVVVSPSTMPKRYRPAAGLWGRGKHSGNRGGVVILLMVTP